MLLIFVLMAFVQIPGLIKKKYWKELIAFSFFYMAAFTVSLLYVLDITIPSPIKGVKYVIEDLLKIKY